MQVLLHHEQFKIPENLARFAVKAGMGGFVKKMGPAVVNFVANRRQRVDPVRSACYVAYVNGSSLTACGFAMVCLQDRFRVGWLHKSALLKTSHRQLAPHHASKVGSAMQMQHLHDAPWADSRC